MVDKKSLIEAKNLSKSYVRKGDKSIQALEGINLEVLEGEFFAVSGRSGSGKTTLLNLLGALDCPTSGEVRIEGKNLGSCSKNQLADLRREKIGFIFQSFNLLPSLKVLENIESGLFFSKIPKQVKQQRISELLDFLDLEGMEDRLPLELSVGQQQKVAIARAIVKNPTIILADEPTGEMDSISGKEVMNKLIEIKNKFKIGLIVATHNFDFGLGVERFLYLKDGKN